MRYDIRKSLKLEFEFKNISDLNVLNDKCKSIE